MWADEHASAQQGKIRRELRQRRSCHPPGKGHRRPSQAHGSVRAASISSAAFQTAATAVSRRSYLSIPPHRSTYVGNRRARAPAAHMRAIFDSECHD